jgi:hypothetical protein
MNNPEYTTSAPVIGPLIMCSGLDVSANPYETRNEHTVFFVSRAFASLWINSRSTRNFLSKVHARGEPSIPPPEIPSTRHRDRTRIPFSFASVLPFVRRRQPPILPLNPLTRRPSNKTDARVDRPTHRDHEPPIRDGTPKVRRLRSRG